MKINPQQELSQSSIKRFPSFPGGPVFLLPLVELLPGLMNPSVKSTRKVLANPRTRYATGTGSTYSLILNAINLKQ